MKGTYNIKIRRKFKNYIITIIGKNESSDSAVRLSIIKFRKLIINAIMNIKNIHVTIEELL